MINLLFNSSAFFNIVINMAPADIRKEGSAYDLPLALGILAADEKVSKEEIEFNFVQFICLASFFVRTFLI
jgi:predicted ATPase with chaperone activity